MAPRGSHYHARMGRPIRAVGVAAAAGRPNLPVHRCARLSRVVQCHDAGPQRRARRGQCGHVSDALSQFPVALDPRAASATPIHSAPRGEDCSTELIVKRRPRTRRTCADGGSQAAGFCQVLQSQQSRHLRTVAAGWLPDLARRLPRQRTVPSGTTSRQCQNRELL